MRAVTKHLPCPHFAPSASSRGADGVAAMDIKHPIPVQPQALLARPLLRQRRNPRVRRAASPRPHPPRHAHLDLLWDVRRMPLAVDPWLAPDRPHFLGCISPILSPFSSFFARFHRLDKAVPTRPRPEPRAKKQPARGPRASNSALRSTPEMLTKGSTGRGETPCRSRESSGERRGRERHGRRDRDC